VYYYDNKIHGTPPFGFPLNTGKNLEEVHSAIDALYFPNEMRSFTFMSLINETLQQKFGGKKIDQLPFVFFFLSNSQTWIH